jgi:hypothetical protein
MGGQVVPAHMEALPLILAPLARKGKWGAKAPRKTSVSWALCYASVRGCGWKSEKAIAEQALIDMGAGTSDDLPLVIRQSFKDSWYPHSTGMEEIEWQIMLEQFVVSRVVVKDEIIDIDSGWC